MSVVSVYSQDFTEKTKLVAPDRSPGDQFGNAVSISDNFAIIGAYFDGENVEGQNVGVNAGSAYIFERDESGNWNKGQKISGSDVTNGDNFGYSVAISGNYTIVGAYQEDHDAQGQNTAYNAGSAYFFERDSSGKWNQVQKIVASDRAVEDYFGFSVGISGNYAFVGAFLDQLKSLNETVREPGMK